jgi:chitinase
MVNVMTMSFGTGNLAKFNISPQTMSGGVISTMNSTVTQMASVFPGKTTAQLRAMLGITPMIGVNDDGTTFTLADAKVVADYTRTNGFGLLSFWSFQRDRAQSSGGGKLSQYSSVPQSDYQFFNIFKTAGTSVVPGTSPTSAPAPAPDSTTVAAPAPAPSCGSFAKWVQGRSYSAGNIVTYTTGKPYVAKYANPGYDPTISTYYWSAYPCSTTTTSSTTTSSPTLVASCSFPGWVQGKSYSAGNIVSYSGTPYKAKYSNPGYNPTVSTYYWAKHSC